MKSIFFLNSGLLLLDEILVRKFGGLSFWTYFWTTEETYLIFKNLGPLILDLFLDPLVYSLQ
jgi:hypothetical protein